MTDERTYDLAGRIIGHAMSVHSVLGPGFNERVYQNALALELADAGIHFEIQIKLCVFYKDRPVGDFEADMIAEKCFILELKAVEALTKSHEVQLVNYLAATRIDEGLLINSGAASLQYRKKYRTYRSSPPSLQS